MLNALRQGHEVGRFCSINYVTIHVIYIYIIKGSLGEKLPSYGDLEMQRNSEATVQSSNSSGSNNS